MYGASDRMATTTTSASSKTKTMMAQIGATIHSRLTPSLSSSDDSTTAALLSVATVGRGAGRRWIGSAEYADDM